MDNLLSCDLRVNHMFFLYLGKYMSRHSLPTNRKGSFLIVYFIYLIVDREQFDFTCKW